MPRIYVDDAEIHYETSGAGTPVLLLHGLGSCGEDWKPQITALAARHTVVAVDLRGHGKSSKPGGPYSIPMFAGDVVHLLETLALAPAHVVGLSLGGMVAFQLAVDAPSLVRKLVVVNSAPAVVPRTAKEWLLLQSRVWALRIFGLQKLAHRVAYVNFPEPEQAELRRALAARIAGNDEAAYRAAMDANVGWSVEDRIGGIACPTLVVTGDQDYTPVSFKEAYAAKMPRARVVVVQRSRHVTPVDQTAAFNQVLLDFLGASEEPRATWRAPLAAGST
jgi:pimeloyl-ACP methyl ester carboxylesterase